jgi:hypothetical protein
VAELVDALDSKSSDLGRVGSIPTLSTKYPQQDLGLYPDPRISSIAEAFKSYKF